MKRLSVFVLAAASLAGASAAARLEPVGGLWYHIAV
jgi:hypothetical protein